MTVLTLACSGGGDKPPATPASGGATFLIGYPSYVDEETGIRTILGTPDLAVGRHRVGFVLRDAEGLVRLPTVSVESYFHPRGVDGPSEGPAESGTARFFEFPYGTRGIYVIDLAFDRAGTWSLKASLPRPDGSTATTAFAFPVAARTVAPAVGDPAPRSASRTLRDVGSIAELTTSSEPFPALYQQSIAEVLDERRPLVVVFASPAFCTNALCGPQVEVLSELQGIYGERAAFVHVDLYENPHEIKGDLGRAVRTPLLEEWGIETDEWTFVVDAQGTVAARFEAFVTREELEEALLRVLQ